jgi:hypothetical protein
MLLAHPGFTAKSLSAGLRPGQTLIVLNLRFASGWWWSLT